MSTRHFCLCTLWVLMGASTFLLAEEAPTLVIKSAVAVGNEVIETFVLPIVTDASGNVYFRYADSQHRADAISKISPAGKKLFSLDLESVPQLSAAKIADFCISDGKLFVLARRGTGLPEAIIAVFSLSGSLLSTTTVDADVDPFKISPLGRGKFVLAGRLPRLATEWTPSLVVLDDGGHLVKSVSLEGDVVAPTTDSLANSDSHV